MAKQRLLTVACGVLISVMLSASAVSAQISDGIVKIGVLNDMSGTYSDLAGPGSVIAAKMAAEDFGGKVMGGALPVSQELSTTRRSSPSLF